MLAEWNVATLAAKIFPAARRTRSAVVASVQPTFVPSSSHLFRHLSLWHRVLLGNPSSSSSSSLTCRSSPLTTKQITKQIVRLRGFYILILHSVKRCVCVRTVCVFHHSVSGLTCLPSLPNCVFCLISMSKPPQNKRVSLNNMVDQRLGSLPGKSMWTRQTKAETGPPG